MRTAQPATATPVPSKPTANMGMKQGDMKHSGAPSPQDIAMRAYEKWQKAGCPQGDGVNFWLDAEQELRKGK